MSDENTKVAQDVVATIHARMGVPVERITPQADIVNDLGADSLDFIELIMDLEEKFDIEIKETEFEDIHTVEDVTRFIEKRLDV